MTTPAAEGRHSSAYHQQWDAGFSNLRFQKRIEDEYRFRSLQASLPQIRITLFAAVCALAGLFVVEVLFSEVPTRINPMVSRFFAVEALLLGLMLLTFNVRLRHFLPGVSLPGAAVVGLGTAASSIAAVGQDGTLVFSGCFIVTVYIYFLLGARWLPAVLTGAIVLASFGLLGALTGAATASLINVFVLLCATNAAGAWGLYDLEYNRRKNFLKSRMLTYLAERDPLTGIPNRKALDRLLRHAWSQCRAESKPISVALVDVDYFKAYNDTYGHQAGDRCLDHVARALVCAARRPRDAVGRYGGEEFLIVLPEASEYYALVLLDSIREQVESLNIEHTAAASGAVTVSIGVAFCMPHSTDMDCKEFVNLADQALYKAKSQGRNRVVLGVRDAGHGAAGHKFGDKVSIAFTSPV